MRPNPQSNCITLCLRLEGDVGGSDGRHLKKSEIDFGFLLDSYGGQSVGKGCFRATFCTSPLIIAKSSA